MEDNAIAFGLLLRAIEAEPENAQFLAAAAETLHHRKAVGWPSLTSNDQETAFSFVRRAWEQSESDAESLSLAGNAMFTCGEPELGLVLTEQAAAMNPSSSLILGCAGHSQLWIGDLETARSYYERAIVLAPNDLTTRFAYGSLACVQHLTGNPNKHCEPQHAATHYRQVTAATSGT